MTTEDNTNRNDAELLNAYDALPSEAKLKLLKSSGGIEETDILSDIDAKIPASLTNEQIRERIELEDYSKRLALRNFILKWFFVWSLTIVTIIIIIATVFNGYTGEFNEFLKNMLDRATVIAS